MGSRAKVSAIWPLRFRILYLKRGAIDYCQPSPLLTISIGTIDFFFCSGWFICKNSVLRCSRWRTIALRMVCSSYSDPFISSVQSHFSASTINLKKHLLMLPRWTSSNISLSLVVFGASNENLIPTSLTVRLRVPIIVRAKISSTHFCFACRSTYPISPFVALANRLFSSLYSGKVGCLDYG